MTNFMSHLDIILQYYHLFNERQTLHHHHLLNMGENAMSIILDAIGFLTGYTMYVSSI